MLTANIKVKPISFCFSQAAVHTVALTKQAMFVQLLYKSANCNKSRMGFVFNVHLEEFNCLLVGETSRLEVVLRERDGSDSPNN